MAPTEFPALPFGLTPIQLGGLITILLGLCYVTFIQRPAFPSKCPKVVSDNWPIVGALGFWNDRRTWWIQMLQQTKTKNFSFHVGKYRIIGTASEEGRKAYFNSRQLSFAEGYAVLFGQAPELGDNNPSQTDESEAYFHRRIVALLKTERFAKCLPILISDIRTRLDELAASSPGETDPFDSIFKLVYVLTQRVVGADEIAESRQLLDQTLNLFQQIESTSTPVQIMYPWLPTPALLKRYIAGGKMYMIFQRIVASREKNEKRIDDPLQFLIDKGDNITKIIGFVVGALFAGQLNSGINAAWILCYLATSPRWMTEVREEILAVANQHVPGEIPLLEKLSRLPLDVWENGFPMADLCLKESIRLQLHGTGFRKNTSKQEITIDGEIIPPDSFLIYHFGDHHRNPEVFANPEQWDPSRYLPDRAEDKKVPNAFIGWGTGRHPCLGMRFAKLEQNLITAFFCTMFDFELYDQNGKKMEDPPEAQAEAKSACAPAAPVKLRYKLRE